ncbi:MAG TPA: vanadium-dependent haloperoxidase [Vicinamibacterales bacterium]|nr:vanadium-dependent haloperoxidase [Vicinamibacterales bacterium]
MLDIALAHAAMHDAVQAIQGRFESYEYVNPTWLGVGSTEAAAAAAADGVLRGLYGATPACLIGVISPSVMYAGDPGLAVGNEAAQALLLLYRPPFTTSRDPFVGGTEPGQWRPTPGITAGANVYMSETTPFALLSPRQFRPEPTTPLTSQRYAREYEEVKRLGSLTSTDRTAAQTDLARFWGSLFGPILNAGLRTIADAHVPDIGDKARLFALVSIAVADSQIAVYETKYHYNFWRPITAIREGDNDGNPDTAGDPTWVPLIATPPYPDHSSGANNVSGSFLGMLRLFFHTDDFEFALTSPVGGLLTNPRQYQRFSQVEEEVVDVRILQGIHFRTADEQGRQQGERIAHWVFQKFLRPLPGK